MIYAISAYVIAMLALVIATAALYRCKKAERLIAAMRYDRRSFAKYVFDLLGEQRAHLDELDTLLREDVLSGLDSVIACIRLQGEKEAKPRAKALRRK